MIILQLDSEQLSAIVKSSVRHVLDEKSTNVNSEFDTMLDITEASKFLKLSIPTVYGLVHKLEIPVNKKGKRLYFSRQELINWIKEGRKKTVYEIKKDFAYQKKRSKI